MPDESERAGTNPVHRSPAPSHAGGVQDRDVGLIRFGARDYDASIGQWTSRDSRRPTTLGISTYAYAGNDPQGLIDPSGEVFRRPTQAQQEAIGRLKANRQIGRLIADLESDENVVIFLTETEEPVKTGALTDFKGGPVDYAYVTYNMDSATKAMEAHQLPINLDQLLAHELGHVWANHEHHGLTKEESNQWSVDFENAVRGSNCRESHEPPKRRFFFF
ncbi:MAG: hypothetical protein HY791_28465 [Deltaproteobacteria bacterium]|nr:hypothetical protein [Deltaproteobacteria bacterium]